MNKRKLEKKIHKHLEKSGLCSPLKGKELVDYGLKHGYEKKFFESDTDFRIRILESEGLL